MKLTIRTTLLGALTPLVLTATPALAHATTTTSANARTEQTINRFYDRADRFTVRDGFDRIESQRRTLRPFYEQFTIERHNGTLGLPINQVEAFIYDGVVSYAQAPLAAQEEATARQLQSSTTGTAHADAELLTTYFTDEVDASTSLHARYSLVTWEHNRFFDGVPTGIDRLGGFLNQHRGFLARDVDGGDPFRSVEPAVSAEQRTVTALQAQTLEQTTNGLDLLTSQIARGWEGEE